MFRDFGVYSGKKSTSYEVFHDTKGCNILSYMMFHMLQSMSIGLHSNTRYIVVNRGEQSSRGWFSMVPIDQFI